MKFQKDERDQLGGWAPGNYTSVCMYCEVEFLGDKRAISCADCVYDRNALAVKTEEELAHKLGQFGPDMFDISVKESAPPHVHKAFAEGVSRRIADTGQ